MAHAQKPDFLFQRNGRVHLNRRRISSVDYWQPRRISGSNAGYTMLRGSVKSTGYPLHLPVSPSLPFPCVTVCHQASTGLYYLRHSCRNRRCVRRDLFNPFVKSSSANTLVLYRQEKRGRVILVLRRLLVIGNINPINYHHIVRKIHP